MRGRQYALGAAALALLCFGCNTISQTVTGPTIDDHSGGGGPSASPSPGAGSGTLPAGSQVRIGLFGQSCPAGTTPPNNGLRQLIYGCQGFVTATPKGPDGVDLPPAVHGPNIAWSSTGPVDLSAATEPFNRDARCRDVGPFSISAQVKDVTGNVGMECLANPSQRSLGPGVIFWTELANTELKTRARAAIAKLDGPNAPARWEHTLQ